ncbi:MAG TPA: helicase SNF2 [Chloroflexi bacterium]|jgi:superfamily II DNA or RNA helicase|nr:helicase SNF2 [Chloroflexota bacterium]HCG29370.1 helicase SNF2 [Chloroflexota bacterium]
MITRHSSRRESLAGFLPGLLDGAVSYDRIAGYFRSSMLEVAGEALEAMGPGARVRVVCNSDLSPLDIQTARAAKTTANAAMYREWRASLPEDISPALRARLERLHGFLADGRLQVRVLPDEVFGLVHGKAGVVERADGGAVAFLGSANESKRAWTLNYEIVWTDDSPEGVAWVREEFERLWHNSHAVDLADAVVQDIARVARRVVLPGVPDWKKPTGSDPGAAAIELPVYLRENGLWAHQKSFVERAFREHQEGGARLLLADQVGLGKTIQLALAAKLMTLWDGGNVLVIAPKPLLGQWQDELWTLLQLPSAVWTGKGWVDERGVERPAGGIDGLADCPRKVGIVSGGLVTHSEDVRRLLAAGYYECVIVDEAHKARRRNLGPTRRNESAEPNNLLQFLRAVSKNTRSMLLATATPVQLDPIEAFDLLHALNGVNRSVLGREYSRWIGQPRDGLDFAMGRQSPPQDIDDAWQWIRDPLPPAVEERTFAIVRSALGLSPTGGIAKPEDLNRLRPPDRSRLAGLSQRFFTDHNPYIRHIIRRTRQYLEETADPETNEPYLKPVRVRLFGEDERGAVPLPAFLREAYDAAEEFCVEVGRRPGLNSGFLKTILLRRIGSSIVAGYRTAEKMLGPSELGDEDDEDDDLSERSSLYPLTDAEREKLQRCMANLRGANVEDPKYREVERLLLEGVDDTGPWLEQGCIVFSQYFDTAEWVAGKLSERLPDEPIGLYAGAGRSAIYRGGAFTRIERDTLKESVRAGELRLLIGTDAASEGLNLQRLGTLINLDLPWNPTRLEQRKGRIQRIGQVRDEVYVYNMRYRGSVEDRVHQLLSSRLEAITDLFGQLPDTLEDVWVKVALKQEAEAEQRIREVREAHPFSVRNDKIERVDWESCSTVLDAHAQLEALLRGWAKT